MTKSQVLVQNHKSWSSPDFPQNAFQEGLGLLYRMATCWSKPNHQPTGCIAHVGRQVAADRRWLMSVMTVTRTGAGHGRRRTGGAAFGGVRQSTVFASVAHHGGILKKRIVRKKTNFTQQNLNHLIPTRTWVERGYRGAFGIRNFPVGKNF